MVIIVCIVILYLCLLLSIAATAVAAAGIFVICVAKCFDILIAVIYRKVHSALVCKSTFKMDSQQTIYCYCLTERNRIELKCRWIKLSATGVFTPVFALYWCANSDFDFISIHFTAFMNANFDNRKLSPASSETGKPRRERERGRKWHMQNSDAVWIDDFCEKAQRRGLDNMLTMEKNAHESNVKRNRKASKRDKETV